MQCHLERFIREWRRKEAFSSNNSEKLLRRHFQRGLEAAAAVRTEKARAKEENSTLALKLPFSANKTRIDTATALKFKCWAGAGAGVSGRALESLMK